MDSAFCARVSARISVVELELQLAVLLVPGEQSGWYLKDLAAKSGIAGKKSTAEW